MREHIQKSKSRDEAKLLQRSEEQLFEEDDEYGQEVDSDKSNPVTRRELPLARPVCRPLATNIRATMTIGDTQEDEEMKEANYEAIEPDQTEPSHRLSSQLADREPLQGGGGKMFISNPTSDQSDDDSEDEYGSGCFMDAQGYDGIDSDD